MLHHVRARRRGPGADLRAVPVLALVLAVLAALLTVVLPGATQRANADTAPPPPTTLTTVSADSLPTVQVNGVVWAQVVVGNTVYATGAFTSARPAGAAAGTNETPRSNIIAYNLSTGAMLTNWAPTLNAQGLTITASADGSRIYVGGDFTTVSGVARNRVVALDATTGAVITGFNASVNSRVRTLAVAGDVIYAGGLFTTSAGQTRTRLAAFSATTGALNTWAPTADREVLALVAPAGSGKVIAAGRFSTLNGAANYGSGALDATTGANLPWAANAVVRNAGDDSAMNSLSTDGNVVYGSGYTFGGGGNLESAYAADVATGNIIWVSGCRGDTYSTMPLNGVLYHVGHEHNCSQIGNFPQEDPWTFQRAIAFSATPGLQGAVNTSGNFNGRPAPDFLHWAPTLDVGTYTGQAQAAWSVSGNSQYVVLGGEFPRVNWVGQQGLARFAVRSIAPNRDGPQTPNELAPTLTTVAPGALRVSWQATWDRDNRRLTYQILRNDVVVGTVTADSEWWNRPTVSWVDTTGTPGSAVTYRIRARDPLGVQITGQPTSGTFPAGAAASTYVNAVYADGAKSYWRLGEASGGTAYDWAAGSNLTLGNYTRGTAGAISGSSDTATTFGGIVGVSGATSTAAQAPQTYSSELWFRTTSTSGGKLVGYGNRNNNDSSSYDRHVYLSNDGRINFGVSSGGAQVITTGAGYNDGQWHHVVAALGVGGMQLYVDGALAGSRADVTSGARYSGYWRVANDAIAASWPNRPSSTRFSGALDDVAVYPNVLDAGTVLSHYQLGKGVTPNQDPVAAFTTTASGLTASADAATSSDPDGTITSYAWTWGDGATGTGATASHAYAAGGTFPVTLTVTDDKGATATATRNVTVTAPPPNQAPAASFTVSAADLTASANAGASSDPDGTIASYAWTWGDGATGTGATASHTYAAAGTYTVGLTVTDDDGDTGSTTRTVTVTAPGSTVAADTFGRTVASGWGTADTGGAWTSGGTGTSTSVTGSQGQVTVQASRTNTLRLNGVSTPGSDLRFTVQVPSLPTGGGTYVSANVRGNAGGDYRAKVRLMATGQVQVQLVKVVGGVETGLTTTATVSGLTFAAGGTLAVRAQAEGSAPTTLRVKVWTAGGTEPAAWAQTVTDADAGLQGAGSVGVVTYNSGSATADAVIRVDDLAATRL